MHPYSRRCDWEKHTYLTTFFSAGHGNAGLIPELDLREKEQKNGSNWKIDAILQSSEEWETGQLAVVSSNIPAINTCNEGGVNDE